jgi:hypothetical protein
MTTATRHTTFFRLGDDLAVFARHVVDVEEGRIFDIPVDLLCLDKLGSNQAPFEVDGIVRHFWVVRDVPQAVLHNLTEFNHAVRGMSGYRVAQPLDPAALILLREAEVAAKEILFQTSISADAEQAA